MLYRLLLVWLALLTVVGGAGAYARSATAAQVVTPTATRLPIEIRLNPGDRVIPVCVGGRLNGTVNQILCDPPATASPTRTATASPTASASPTGTTTPTQTATQTPSASPTPSPTASPTASPTPSPTSVSLAGQPCPSWVDSDDTIWHPAVDPATGCYYGHEHGDAPPDWVVNSGFAPKFRHAHNTSAAETEIKHTSFKGYYLTVTSSGDHSSTLINWADVDAACDPATGEARPGIAFPYGTVTACGFDRDSTDAPVRIYVIAHGNATPTERQSIFHSIQVWINYRGGTSYWPGWYDMGLPWPEGQGGDRQIRTGGGLPPNPILGGPGGPSDPSCEQWYVRAGGPGGYADGQSGGVFAPAILVGPNQYVMDTDQRNWFRPNSSWMLDFGITFCAAQTYIQYTADRLTPFDFTTWARSGREQAARRVELVWNVGGRTIPPDGLFWTTQLGQIVSSRSDSRCTQPFYAYPDNPLGGMNWNPQPFWSMCAQGYMHPLLGAALREGRVRSEFRGNVLRLPVEVEGIDPYQP